MDKMKQTALLCFIVVLVGAGTIFAQTQTPSRVSGQSAQAAPRAGDGVTAWDHDGDGIPNGQDPDFVKGAGQGRRLDFVDANNDGICDVYQSGARGRGRWAGRGRRAGGTGALGSRFVDSDGDGVNDAVAPGGKKGRPGGRGGGPNFIDANGDGICDYFQQGGQRLGQGRGYRNGRGSGRNR